MRMIPTAWAGFGAIILMGCLETKVTQPTGHKISGKVVTQGVPVAAAKVSLSNTEGKVTAITSTGSGGDFSFSNIAEGSHTLTAEKQTESGQLLSQTQSLQVSGDMVLASLSLPIPPLLKEIPVPQSESVSLAWNASLDMQQFREYKLFRKKDPGIDETHGDLIFVGTRGADTQFTDNASALDGDIYYRVYTMNEFGKMGGSNILKHTIPYSMTGFFKNASFESGDQLWSLYDAFKTPIWGNFVDEEHYWLAVIDSTQAFQGTKSLRLTFGKGRSLVYSLQYTASKTGITGLQPNRKYTASFMLKFASCKDTEVRIWIQSGEVEYKFGYAPTEGTLDEWQKITAEFTTATDVAQQENTFQINFGRFGVPDYEGEEYRHDTAWVDDLRIQPKP